MEKARRAMENDVEFDIFQQQKQPPQRKQVLVHPFFLFLLLWWCSSRRDALDIYWPCLFIFLFWKNFISKKKKSSVMFRGFDDQQDQAHTHKTTQYRFYQDSGSAARESSSKSRRWTSARSHYIVPTSCSLAIFFFLSFFPRPSCIHWFSGGLARYTQGFCTRSVPRELQALLYHTAAWHESALRDSICKVLM